MVGIDMKKHMENIRAGKPFNVEDSLMASDADEFALGDSGPLKGIIDLAIDYILTTCHGTLLRN